MGPTGVCAVPTDTGCTVTPRACSSAAVHLAVETSATPAEIPGTVAWKLRTVPMPVCVNPLTSRQLTVRHALFRPLRLYRQILFSPPLLYRLRQKKLCQFHQALLLNLPLPPQKVGVRRSLALQTEIPGTNAGQDETQLCALAALLVLQPASIVLSASLRTAPTDALVSTANPGKQQATRVSTQPHMWVVTDASAILLRTPSALSSQEMFAFARHVCPTNAAAA
mmetsp:Transcript_28984/g.56877  ORF Transcript_28984/g.56877 Transcript_28984/m.56877 type:complete len:224 (-) Transcript_28984:1193-1864(-)